MFIPSDIITLISRRLKEGIGFESFYNVADVMDSLSFAQQEIARLIAQYHKVHLLKKSVSYEIVPEKKAYSLPSDFFKIISVIYVNDDRHYVLQFCEDEKFDFLLPSGTFGWFSYFKVPVYTIRDKQLLFAGSVFENGLLKIQYFPLPHVLHRGTIYGVNSSEGYFDVDVEKILGIYKRENNYYEGAYLYFISGVLSGQRGEIIKSQYVVSDDMEKLRLFVSNVDLASLVEGDLYEIAGVCPDSLTELLVLLTLLRLTESIEQTDPNYTMRLLNNIKKEKELLIADSPSIGGITYR